MFIELCGVPAAGETTTAELLAEALGRRGYRTVMVREAASKAPVSHLKLDWRYVAWTSCELTRSFLEAEQYENQDIVILDRGFLDTVCWLRWHRAKRRLDQGTFETLREFAEISSWFDLVSHIFELQVSYATALRRRRGFAGRILNKRTYAELKLAYRVVGADLFLRRKPRRSVEIIDTDLLSPESVVLTLMDKLELPPRPKRSGELFRREWQCLMTIEL
jgi:thymidylate kinase